MCSVPGCGKKHHAKGLCDYHYKRQLLHGSPTALADSRRKLRPEDYPVIMAKLTKRKLVKALAREYGVANSTMSRFINDENKRDQGKFLL